MHAYSLSFSNDDNKLYLYSSFKNKSTDKQAKAGDSGRRYNRKKRSKVSRNKEAEQNV